jgi:hypothetical protein
MKLNPAEAEQFRIRVMEYRDWPDPERKFAEVCAMLVELGIADYDSELDIVTYHHSRMIDLLTDKDANHFPITFVLFFSQLPNVEIRWKPSPEGMLLEGESGEWLPSGGTGFKIPSLEEFLAE